MGPVGTAPVVGPPLACMELNAHTSRVCVMPPPTHAVPPFQSSMSTEQLCTQITKLMVKDSGRENSENIQTL